MLLFEQELEAISQKGCTYVRLVIEKINNQQIPQELQHLSRQQIQQIQQELVNLMSVYEKSYQ